MSIDLLTQLKTLHLYGMAEAWIEIQAEAPRQPPLSAEMLLRRLIQAKTTDRQAQFKVSIACAMDVTGVSLTSVLRSRGFLSFQIVSCQQRHDWHLKLFCA